jgi:hypothetical protein
MIAVKKASNNIGRTRGFHVFRSFTFFLRVVRHPGTTLAEVDDDLS